MANLTEHAKKVLEFQEVKEIIARHAHWQWSREKILALEPKDNIEDIYEFQNEIRQLQEIVSSGDTFGLEGIADITGALKASSKHIILDVSDFIAIKNNIEIAASLKKEMLPWSHLPFIHYTGERLAAPAQLREAIGRTFDESSRIRDNASSELAAIRSESRYLQDDIQQRMQAILRDTHRQKMFQEQLFTVREGRYVIPIKQEFRGIFEGLVLDTSASGATVFMEPMSIVEQNNNLRHLLSEEKAETDRILKNLTQMVARNARELKENLEVLAHFDTVYAIALFARQADAVMPVIGTSGRLKLKKARHPLLYGKAIPLDIEIGRDFYTLVITGPNTGGKTVTLKTVGLFTLLGLSGLPLPAEEDSEISLFTKVYADIGDEQSIAQNLSTFSSHMNQIISIIGEADRNTLILLDELGAGTDPREGTAIGIALLEHLTSVGARTVVTTHYGELKYFAGNHPMARNAAMEFDSGTLMPSYRINIGMPGRSCALAIAKRLGLPAELLERAEGLISHEYIELDNLLADIETKEKQVQQELRMNRKFTEEAQILKEKYEKELTLVKAEQTELLIEASGEAESLIMAAKSEIQKTVNSFRKQMHQALKASDENKVRQASETANTKLDEIIAGLEKFRKKRSLSKNRLIDTKLKTGDRVYVPSFDRKGVVVEVKNEEVLVQMDSLKTRLPIWNLRTVQDRKPIAEPPDEKKEDFRLQKTPAEGRTINLIGNYVDEALYNLEKFIDQSMLEEAKSIQIVHGMGTGALRNGIHRYLRQHPGVSDFRLGEKGEGSSGATIVYLK